MVFTYICLYMSLYVSSLALVEYHWSKHEGYGQHLPMLKPQQYPQSMKCAHNSWDVLYGYFAYRGYPAKRALSAMRKHGG